MATRRAKVAYSEEGKTINSAEFEIDSGCGEYIRITVTDKCGKSAYTRACFLDELDI